MDRRTRIARRWSFALDAVAFAMTTANLDVAVVGGIIRLMCHAWGDGTGAPTLPPNDSELTRIAGLETQEQWVELLDAVRDQWRAGPDGRMYFADQLAQYEKKATLSGKRAKAGGRGGLTKAARQERDRIVAVTDADEIDGTWQKIRERYPKRRGDHSWKEAQRHYRAAIARGVQPSDLLAAVERYGAFMHAEGKIGTPFVKQARTFFGPERHYESDWSFEPVPARASVPSTIAGRMRASAPVAPLTEGLHPVGKP